MPPPKGGPAGLEPGHGDPVGGARYVVEFNVAEKLDRLVVPTVVATNSHMQIWLCKSSLFDSYMYEGADSIYIEALERRHSEDPMLG